MQSDVLILEYYYFLSRGSNICHIEYFSVKGHNINHCLLPEWNRSVLSSWWPQLLFLNNDVPSKYGNWNFVLFLSWFLNKSWYPPCYFHPPWLVTPHPTVKAGYSLMVSDSISLKIDHLRMHPSNFNALPTRRSLI